MKKRFLIASILFGAIVALGLGLATPTLAQTDPGAQSLELLGKTGLGGATPADAGNQLPIIIGNVIRAALGLLGIVLVVLMLYAGFLWMTARGNSDQVEKAKSTIIRAVVGALIIFSAYAITGFVVNAIVNASKAS